MIVGSIKEDLASEKRVSITPETAKNILGLGLKVCIEKDYAIHLGIDDEEYKKNGVLVGSNRPFNTCNKGKEFFAEVTIKNNIIVKVNWNKL